MFEKRKALFKNTNINVKTIPLIFSVLPKDTFFTLNELLRFTRDKISRLITMRDIKMLCWFQHVNMPERTGLQVNLKCVWFSGALKSGPRSYLIKTLFKR